MKKAIGRVLALSLYMGALTACQTSEPGTVGTKEPVATEEIESESAASESEAGAIASSAAESANGTGDAAAVNQAYKEFGGEENDNYYCGVIYLGSTLDTSIEEYREMYNDCAWAASAEVCSVTGEDAYLIVPKYEGAEVTVQSYEAIEDQKTEIVLSTSEPIFLECNISDIMPNSWITVESAEGQCEFSPFISLKDGSVSASAGVLTVDGSQYE